MTELCTYFDSIFIKNLQTAIASGSKKEEGGVGSTDPSARHAQQTRAFEMVMRVCDMEIDQGKQGGSLIFHRKMVREQRELLEFQGVSVLWPSLLCSLLFSTLGYLSCSLSLWVSLSRSLLLALTHTPCAHTHILSLSILVNIIHVRVFSL